MRIGKVTRSFVVAVVVALAVCWGNGEEWCLFFQALFEIV